MTKSYSYGNTFWKDQLTSYDGQSITYDEIGNPLTYRGYIMTWDGRKLVSTVSGNKSLSFEYDSSGMRRSKTVSDTTITYEYLDGKLVHEDRGSVDLYYSYDMSGNLAKIEHVNGSTKTTYYVTTNSRGDVEGIYDASGNLKARYIYGSWGAVKKIVDANGNSITSTSHIGILNPIRYRGYYQDSETGLYYLGSRYYDPEVGRWINADGDVLEQHTKYCPKYKSIEF